VRSQEAIPAIGWLRTYRRTWLRADVVGGITAGLVVVPQAMAYATIADLPVQVGLYTCMVPMAVYALVGGSRVLSVSTTSTIATLTASTLVAAGVAAESAKGGQPHRARSSGPTGPRPPCLRSRRCAAPGGDRHRTDGVLEDHGFTTYIASGGDRDFMRPVAGDLYGVPPERVIGSSLTLDYRHDDDGSGLLYKPQMEFFDDGPTKPVRIWSRIGRRPTAAVGNSNGDVPMLHFAGGPSGPALRLLLLHDDPDREFDYTAGAEEALDQARAHRWTVISIKNDWSTVFPEHPRSPAAAADRR
jgi:hypothetical protein